MLLQLLNIARDLGVYLIGGIGLLKTIDLMKPIMTDNEYNRISKAYKILFYPSNSLLESIKERKKDKEDRKKKIAMEAYEKVKTMLNPYPECTITSTPNRNIKQPSYDSTTSRCNVINQCTSAKFSEISVNPSAYPEYFKDGTIIYAVDIDKYYIRYDNKWIIIEGGNVNIHGDPRYNYWIR